MSIEASPATTTAGRAPASTTTAPPPFRWRRAVLIVAGLVVLAAVVALILWGLTSTGTPTHSHPVTVTTAPAAPVDGYAQFCQNNSDLCQRPSPGR
jgi:hypothetical protein